MFVAKLLWEEKSWKNTKSGPTMVHNSQIWLQFLVIFWSKLQLILSRPFIGWSKCHSKESSPHSKYLTDYCYCVLITNQNCCFLNILKKFEEKRFRFVVSTFYQLPKYQALICNYMTPHHNTYITKNQLFWLQCEKNCSSTYKEL